MDENEDGRVKRTALSANRAARETVDRTVSENRGLDDRAATENRELTDADRLEMFRMQLFNDALPNLPPIPGWHVCWLTTTNPSDSIQARTRLGYEPVRPEDVPGAGLENAMLKTGDYAGLIGVNEMVAFKLPESLYQMFMKEAHHDAPLRQEQMIVEQLDSLNNQAEQVGGRIVEGDGMTALREAAPRVKHFT